MPGFIPGVFVEDSHFRDAYYEFNWRTEARDDYQDALNAATELAISKRKEPPISRVDGFEYPRPKYTPIVLKAVELMVRPDLAPQQTNTKEKKEK